MPELSESRRLRRGRVSEKGGAYMVTSTVLDRRNVFADWRVGRLLVAELKAAQEKGLARSMAWVSCLITFTGCLNCESPN